MRRQVLDLIAADEAAILQQSFELLISITGIAAASAIQLLGELLALPEEMRAKQWVAMAGLDPRAYQSGSSMNKKPRLSKTGLVVNFKRVECRAPRARVNPRSRDQLKFTTTQSR